MFVLVCWMNVCIFPRIICSNICTNIPLCVHNSVTLKGVFIWIFTQVFIFIWAFTHMNICISVPGSVLISPTWNTRQEEKTLLLGRRLWPGRRPAVFFVGQPLHLAWSRTDLWFVVWRPSPEGSHLHQQVAVIPGAGHHCPWGPEARPHPLPAVQAHPRPQGLIRWGVAGVQGGGTGLVCLLLVVMACSLLVAWTCLQPFHSDLRHTWKGKIKHSALSCPPCHSAPSSEALPKLWPLPGATYHVPPSLNQLAESFIALKPQVEGLSCEVFPFLQPLWLRSRGYLVILCSQAFALGLKVGVWLLTMCPP